MAEIIVAAVVALLVIITVLRSVRIIPQARARNVERFGRYRKTLEPGMNFIIPGIDRVNRCGGCRRRGLGGYAPARSRLRASLLRPRAGSGQRSGWHQRLLRTRNRANPLFSGCIVGCGRPVL